MENRHEWGKRKSECSKSYYKGGGEIYIPLQKKKLKWEKVQVTRLKNNKRGQKKKKNSHEPQ